MANEINNAFDSKNFRALGHQLIDILADHMELIGQSDQFKAVTWESPGQVFEKWERDLRDDGAKVPIHFFQTVLRESVQLRHPNYMGHQIAPTVPISVLAGLLSDYLNNGMGVYEMGVQSSSLEKLVIQEFAKMMGLSQEADGFLTSGGTLGNLTALLAARSIKANQNVWRDGHARRLALMVSEEAHYCVDRAARIMGWGAEGIIKVPSNEQFEMDTSKLPELLDKAQSEGIQVVAIIGSACSTSTGSFDDLNAIADFCEQHDLWFHVDGAHGGAFAISSKYRHLVAGIERADSVVMDFHKSLAIPSITTGLFFKDGRQSYQTFSQKADYLFKTADAEWYNYAKRTFECTKLMMSIKVYAVLKYHGAAFFDAYVNRLVEMGSQMAEIIAQNPHFELALHPACNIVCFRYHPEHHLNDAELNTLNDQIRTTILEEGKFYIVKTILNGVLWLRSTLTNPFTSELHIQNLLEEIELIGSRNLAPV